MDASDLPFDIKLKLSKISKQLPENRRSAFCQSAGARIVAFAQDFLSSNKYALVYGAIGYVLGSITESMIDSIPLVGWGVKPFTRLIPWSFALLGGYQGFLKDRDVERIKRIVAEELARYQN